MWLSWPSFHAPLHNFTPRASSVGSRHASLDPAAASNAFLHNFANTGPRNSLQLSNRCAVCWKKAISKITFNIRWNLKQIWCLWHTWVSKGNIKGFENNGVWVACLISSIIPSLGSWPRGGGLGVGVGVGVGGGGGWGGWGGGGWGGGGGGLGAIGWFE